MTLSDLMVNRPDSIQSDRFRNQDLEKVQADDVVSQIGSDNSMIDKPEQTFPKLRVNSKNQPIRQNEENNIHFEHEPTPSPFQQQLKNSLTCKNRLTETADCQNHTDTTRNGKIKGIQHQNQEVLREFQEKIQKSIKPAKETEATDEALPSEDTNSSGGAQAKQAEEGESQSEYDAEQSTENTPGKSSKLDEIPDDELEGSDPVITTGSGRKKVKWQRMSLDWKT
jgi:hypothetical protein